MKYASRENEQGEARLALLLVAVLVVVVLILAVGFGGCGYSFQIQPPDHFIELEDQEPTYSLRATSADGLVLAVREIDNDPYADREFWVEAVSNELRFGQGYALVETTEVSAQTGQMGTLMKFGREDGSGTYAYWVALFADDSYVWVVEAGGREEQFVAEEAAIESAFSSLRLN